MCIIVYIPPGESLPLKKIKEMHLNNPDGFGIACANQDDIFHIKGVFDWQQIQQVYTGVIYENSAWHKVLHFRTASSSGVSNYFAHPFEIDENTLFFHNGNLFECSRHCVGREYDNLSDSRIFLETILKKLPGDFLDNDVIMDAITDYSINNFSKMIFLRPGNINIINEEAGYWMDNGIWFSNGGIDDYTGYGYSGAYYYKTGDIRHKGGLLSPKYLVGEAQEKWKKCVFCNGYFRDLENAKCNGCNIFLKLKQLTEERIESNQH